MIWRFPASTSFSSFTKNLPNKLHSYYDLSICFFEHIIFEGLFELFLLHLLLLCLLLHFVMWKTFIQNFTSVALWDKCEDETHTPKSGKLESSGTPDNSKLEFKGQNTSHWSVLYINGKFLNCRCPKWPRMCIWTSAAQVMAKRRAKSQIGNLTPDH
jgi:hypothetical protein